MTHTLQFGLLGGRSTTELTNYYNGCHDVSTMNTLLIIIIIIIIIIILNALG